MSFHVDALIVGGGFSGVYALHKFREQLPDLSVKIVEAGGALGGVWYWNRYPGARVDSEIPFYQLSVPQAYKTFKFKERFPCGQEIREYFAHLDKVLKLSDDTIYNTVIKGVSWDTSWICKTTDGRILTCNYLVIATGSSHKTYLPQFDGLELYGGKAIHAAAYPLECLDVTGKKVAVIGNGASGLQIIQELAFQDCQLTAYIRTPVMALPMRQREMTVAEQSSLESFYGSLLKTARASRPGFPYDGPTKAFADATDEERQATMEDLWQRGGFSFFIGNYPELVVDRGVNRYVYDFWAKKVRERVSDPVKRDIIAPLEQEHLFGVKRPSLEQRYYEAIDRSNVGVVNLKKAPIRNFTSSGILSDIERHHDIVVFATGYDAMTGSLMDLDLTDKNGNSLENKWCNGVETYLGMMISDMPNMFMIYGPQAPTALSNGPSIIESQVDWIVEAVGRARRETIDILEPKHERCLQWREAIQSLNNETLYPFEDSWYMGANIPGKVREQLNYVAGLKQYNIDIWRVLDTWDGLRVTKLPKQEAVALEGKTREQDNTAGVY